MNKLNLKASNDYEKSILKYLEENASDFLAMKINQGNKTLQSCFSYIRSMAQKKAKNGCAMIEDAVVYGWAIHYFEEDDIAEPEEKKTKEKTLSSQKAISATAKIGKPQDKLQNDNFSIFDFMGV